MKDINILRLGLIIMTTIALPTAIKYDHYVALLIWLVFLLGIGD